MLFSFALCLGSNLHIHQLWCTSSVKFLQKNAMRAKFMLNRIRLFTRDILTFIDKRHFISPIWHGYMLELSAIDGVLAFELGAKFRELDYLRVLCGISISESGIIITDSSRDAIKSFSFYRK